MRRASTILVLMSFAAPARAADPDQAPAAQAPPVGYRDRSGVTELVFWQGVNGLLAGSFLGYAVTAGTVNEHCQTRYGPDMEYSDTCKDALARGGGINVLSLAAGIAVPLWVTRGRPVTTGDAILVNRATLIGAMHGYIIPFAAGLEPFRTGRTDYAVNVDESRWLAGLTFAGDLAGVGVGTYLATHMDMAPGTISLLGTLHSATFLAAMSVGSSFPDEVNQDDARLISSMSLLAADVALAVGISHIDRLDVGRNRVFWIDTGAVVGWLAGAGLGSVIAGNEERAVAIGGTLGMAGGIVLTYLSTREQEGWRRRAEPGKPPVVELQAPAVGWRPSMAGTPGRLHLSLDLLRGTF
jgi:hypothetical protein